MQQPSTSSPVIGHSTSDASCVSSCTTLEPPHPYNVDERQQRWTVLTCSLQHRALAPPAKIVPHPPPVRPRPSPHPIYGGSNDYGSPLSPTAAAAVPIPRTASQHAAMEADAVETLLFLASPGNSGGRSESTTRTTSNPPNGGSSSSNHNSHHPHQNKEPVTTPSPRRSSIDRRPPATLGCAPPLSPRHRQHARLGSQSKLIAPRATAYQPMISSSSLSPPPPPPPRPTTTYSSTMQPSRSSARFSGAIADTVDQMIDDYDDAADDDNDDDDNDEKHGRGGRNTHYTYGRSDADISANNNPPLHDHPATVYTT